MLRNAVFATLALLVFHVCLRDTLAFNWAPSTFYTQKIKNVVRSFDTCMSNTGPFSFNPTNLLEMRLNHMYRYIFQFGRCSSSFEPYCDIHNQLKMIFQLMQLLRSTPSLWEKVLGGPMICSVSIMCLFKNNMMSSMCMNQPAIIPDTPEMFTVWLHRLFPLQPPQVTRPILGVPRLCGPPSGIMSKFFPLHQICGQSLLAPQLPANMMPPSLSPSYPLRPYYPEVGYGHIQAPPNLPALINPSFGPNGPVICQAPDICESSPTSNLLSPQITIQIQNCQPPCSPDHGVDSHPTEFDSDETKSDDSNSDESKSDESKSDECISDNSDSDECRLDKSKSDLDQIRFRTGSDESTSDTSVESPPNPLVHDQNESREVKEAQTSQ